MSLIFNRLRISGKPEIVETLAALFRLEYARDKRIGQSDRRVAELHLFMERVEAKSISLCPTYEAIRLWTQQHIDIRDWFENAAPEGQFNCRFYSAHLISEWLRKVSGEFRGVTFSLQHEYQGRDGLVGATEVLRGGGRLQDLNYELFPYEIRIEVKGVRPISTIRETYYYRHPLTAAIKREVILDMHERVYRRWKFHRVPENDTRYTLFVDDARIASFTVDDILSPLQVPNALEIFRSGERVYVDTVLGIVVEPEPRVEKLVTGEDAPPKIGIVWDKDAIVSKISWVDPKSLRRVPNKLVEAERRYSSGERAIVGDSVRLVGYQQRPAVWTVTAIKDLGMTVDIVRNNLKRYSVPVNSYELVER